MLSITFSFSPDEPTRIGMMHTFAREYNASSVGLEPSETNSRRLYFFLYSRINSGTLEQVTVSFIPCWCSGSYISESSHSSELEVWSNPPVNRIPSLLSNDAVSREGFA